ncbi:hypothetical protein MIR68_012119 [Amoeboaphelidium protococcarum]|nr:hypothetical protein MIR68_012119 [Amoeboaphelidium protococcarum]
MTLTDFSDVLDIQDLAKAPVLCQKTHWDNVKWLGVNDRIYWQALSNAVQSSTRIEINHAKNLLSQFINKEIENIEVKDGINNKFSGDQSSKCNSVTSRSGMRLALSSANASDNYTFSTLSTTGGRALNASVAFDDDSFAVEVSAELLASSSTINDGIEYDGGLLIESTDRMESTDLQCKSIFISSQDLEPIKSRKYDRFDRFWLVYEALHFCGYFDGKMFGLVDLSKGSIDSQFQQHVMHISIVNKGPSRSGFASSSAVSLNLVNSLLRLFMQYIPECRQYLQFMMDLDCELNRQQFGLIVWLFENTIGLKSGRQDIDAPLYGQGLNSWQYGHVCFDQDYAIDRQLIQHEQIDLDLSDLTKRLIIVDTGIQRSTGDGLQRGLNMRHLAYLLGPTIEAGSQDSTNSKAYEAIEQSIFVHEQIVNALQQSNWQLVGKLLLHYMNLRSMIDPIALKSKFDTPHDGQVLLHPVNLLLEVGLIYGGSYSGAMGGGVLLLIASDAAVEDPSLIATALSDVQLIQTSDGSRPFKSIRQLNYCVLDNAGLTTIIQ